MAFLLSSLLCLGLTRPGDESDGEGHTSSPHCSALETFLKLPTREMDTARGVLLAEQAFFKEVDVENGLARVDALVSRLRIEAAKETDFHVRLSAVMKHLFGKAGYRSVKSLENVSSQQDLTFSRLLETKCGICFSLCTLTQAVCMRLSIPVSLVQVGDHSLILLEDGGHRQFYDTINLGRVRKAPAGPFRVLDARQCIAVGLSNLSDILLETGREKAALVAAEKAVAIDCDQALAWLNRGRALSRLDRERKALSCFDVALGLQPDLAAAWTEKGRLCRKLRRHDSEIRSHRMALELRPTSASAWFNLGAAYLGQNQKKAAVFCFDRAAILNPGLVPAWVNKGAALVLLGRFKQAIVCLDRAMSLNPRHPRAWTTRGLALDGLGKPEEALGAYEKALAIDPDFAKAWMYCCFTHHSRGEYRKALQCGQRAKALGLPLSTALENKLRNRVLAPEK